MGLSFVDRLLRLQGKVQSGVNLSLVGHCYVWQANEIFQPLALLMSTVMTTDVTLILSKSGPSLKRIKLVTGKSNT